MRLIRAILQPVSKRWYSAGACASSGTTKKACAKVPKDVRKPMVESFVNRYQKANAGKFPTFSEAKKDVGGSYYVVREIMQELIYNSKMSPPVDTASSEKCAIKKDEVWTEKDSQATEMEEEIINISPISKVAVQDSGSEIIESNHHPQPSISVAGDEESKEVEKQLDGSESTEVSGRELKKVSSEDSEKTPSLWQNMKTLANEILEMWKKK